MVNTKKKVPDKADKEQKAKEQKVQQLVDSLKEKHLSDYTPMQFRIWAEMVASGICIVVWTIRLTPQCSLVLAAALHL